MRKLGFLFLLAACGDNTAENPDLAMSSADMSVADLGPACNPSPMMGDGQSCATGCPNGMVGFLTNGTCTCYYTCTPGHAETCSCDRSCVTLFNPDGGATGEGACVPGQGAGLRCANDCAQGLTCASLDNGPKYCLYDCSASSDCPAQTSCIQIMNGTGTVIGMACDYGYGMAGKQPGGACDMQTDVCTTGYLCDGTCKAQCDGPGGTCAAGVCTKLVDPNKTKTIGYICK